MSLQSLHASTLRHVWACRMMHSNFFLQETRHVPVYLLNISTKLMMSERLVASIIREVNQVVAERARSGSLQEVIVLGHVHWKPTVLGLVANSLKDDHDRPVFLWGKESSPTIKGSCRSDGRVSVVDLMEQKQKNFLHTLVVTKCLGALLLNKIKFTCLNKHFLIRIKAFHCWCCT